MADVDLRCYNRKFTTEFIELYKSLPCLWKVKSRDYKSRTHKNAAYNQMIEKLREVEPIPTRELVTKKINSLRTCRRKEWHKINNAAKSGRVYKPMLWYYDIMNFIDETESTVRSTATSNSADPLSASVESPVKIELDESNLSSEDNVSETNPRISRVSNEPEVYEEYERPTTPHLPPVPPEQPRPPKRKLTNTITDLPNGRGGGTENVEDRIDIFGRSVAIKMRNITTQQRLVAEKIINDTLFKAEMGMLKLSDAIDGV